jgi:mono/diheme cytochrome c family protein
MSRILIIFLALAGGALAQPTQVERGRALVDGIAACGNCHTPKGPQGDLPGMGFAGGMLLEEPGVFRIYPSNITPDRETGIGAWTDAQIIRAIREGVRPDGRVLGPIMPIELYRGISDADAQAMVAYLRTVAPVRNVVPASTYNFPLPPAYGPPLGVVAGPADNAVARGAYMAGPLGHCIECHSPPLATGGRDWSRTGWGGPPMHGPAGVVVPADLTPTHLGAWSDAEITRAITRGVSRDGRALRPPMGFAYYATIPPAEMADLVAYLRSLPPSR